MITRREFRRRLAWLAVLEAFCLFGIVATVVAMAMCIIALVTVSGRLAMYAVGSVVLLALLTAWLEEETRRIKREWK